MWIASPEKTLIIDGDRFFVDEESDGRSYIYVNGNPVASYSTHERAMKVMDMIEDTILKCEAMRTGYAEYDFGAFVFDMPDDKDVEV